MTFKDHFTHQMSIEYILSHLVQCFDPFHSIKFQKNKLSAICNEMNQNQGITPKIKLIHKYVPISL